MSRKVYTTAPLPFMGQKRKFLKQFRKALSDYPTDAIYIDLFGGSGLLSHTVKSHYPEATVIYNDYDNFRRRIEAIAETNVLLSKLRHLLHSYPKDKRLTEELKRSVLNLVKSHELYYGYCDYITLSSAVLFSMKYVQSYSELEKSTLYNKVRLSDYTAAGYLDGLEVVSKDYSVLFNEYKDEDNVVYLVDPPYLQTDNSTYKNYWSLKDYLNVLTVLIDKKYFYFTSNKSSIIELCEWIGDQTVVENPFADATRVDMTNAPSYNSTYTDIMVFK